MIKSTQYLWFLPALNCVTTLDYLILKINAGFMTLKGEKKDLDLLHNLSSASSFDPNSLV
ncbi:hypothetical protein BpHYR1_036962 [Brachionus plicatilis]|uniref:Uncharacterized protein n=1 Tax=Brachionus plicatilis TaxID=10195 RepID=A0A3M7S8Y1_BRAPC|nr:hypothetical protein BpHYR1_036962 [Brachionus plicatilis]